MGKTIPTIRKGETKKEYRDRLLKGASKFNQQTDHMKKKDTSKDDDVYDGKKIEKTEPKEQTMASSSGSFESPAFGSVVKRKINKIHNMNENVGEFKEATDTSSSGAYDVPLFGSTPKGRKNPLKIDGVKSISKSRAVKDKKFPKWGGPGGVFIKIKDKCKKFPYCNQGDINAIEQLREAMESVSKERKIPIKEIEKLVLNEIKEIFIKYENN